MSIDLTSLGYYATAADAARKAVDFSADILSSITSRVSRAWESVKTFIQNQYNKIHNYFYPEDWAKDIVFIDGSGAFKTHFTIKHTQQKTKRTKRNDRTSRRRKARHKKRTRATQIAEPGSNPKNYQPTPINPKISANFDRIQPKLA